MALRSYSLKMNIANIVWLISYDNQLLILKITLELVLIFKYSQYLPSKIDQQFDWHSQKIALGITIFNEYGGLKTNLD